jgi:heme/copper-type cytochrome/quinol oxidase subunit 2
MNTLSLPIACATCLPDPNSAEANAQGFAILVMLGVLGFIFCVLFYTIYSFTRRQRQYAQAEAMTA